MAHDAGSQEALLHWLALHLVPGLGPGGAFKLIGKLGTPQNIFHASVSELGACGVRPAVAQSIVSGVSFEEAAAEAGRARAAGAEIVTLHDPRYPEALKEIYDPPILLYVRGRTELLRSFQVAVVGSRRPTPYGESVAAKLSGELAAAGLVITSGMARGIDTAAHRGALRVGGDTTAVLGCGVEVVYPSESRKLAAEIVSRGLIVSEFPMGSPAYPQNFPIRNRIISGLSAGVMVVEGAQYSGSLITARLAMDQGREVFAVPGSVLSKLSWGPNLLIKQGAALVQEWKDVVEALPTPVRRMIFEALQERLAAAASAGAETSGAGSASVREAAADPGSLLQGQLLNRLRVETSTHIDELMETMNGHSTSEIIAALTELELVGQIRQLPGKNYVRTL